MQRVATYLVNFTISIIVVSILFAMIFRLLPSANVAWGDVLIGAGVTAVLFTVGKFLIGLYIGKLSVDKPIWAANSSRGIKSKSW